MISRVETYKPYRDTGLLYRFFELQDENGAVWGSGMEYLPDEDLLALYQSQPEIAVTDARLNDLLAAQAAAAPEQGEAE